MTVSHLRFGPQTDPFDLSHHEGQFRGLPSAGLPERLDMLGRIRPGGDLFAEYAVRA